jgi:hypothetical protein
VKLRVDLLVLNVQGVLPRGILAVRVDGIADFSPTLWISSRRQRAYYSLFTVSRPQMRYRSPYQKKVEAKYILP